ncbi:hypothetical protein HYH03_012955 [Edaphochlamys debaryana]|uniref:NADH dehydrogenase subunit 4L n=1 Tax=Edaphochlamys debaryana TaxID=47281 RepID=A0A835XQL0_9CHLO|nr:hypothetical protein HYH03_012955 [Edaphochlamys debaryana]|eukprot:KAG2488448.1 hypothetical protein HYH03_012955 [Edaphochlamys debaryana]
MSRTQLLQRLRPWLGSAGPLAQSGNAVPTGLQQQCAFSCGSRKEEEERTSTVAQASPSLVQLASMVNRPMPLSLGSPSGGFAASPLLSMPRRGKGTLAGLRRPLPMLPGMGSSSAPSVRTYYTEGEVFGTTFMYTTNMMFWAGIVGAVAFRRNLIILLLSAETVMLACNMNFLFTAAYLNDITGAIMSITITTIAACETAIGLALCVAYFHMRSATDVEALNLLK